MSRQDPACNYCVYVVHTAFARMRDALVVMALIRLLIVHRRQSSFSLSLMERMATARALTKKPRCTCHVTFRERQTRETLALACAACPDSSVLGEDDDVFVGTSISNWLVIRRGISNCFEMQLGRPPCPPTAQPPPPTSLFPGAFSLPRDPPATPPSWSWIATSAVCVRNVL